jgi:hypothetical protein
VSDIERLPKRLPIPGFLETDWLATGEWMPGGPLGYFKRYLRKDVFPDAPDGKTGVTDAIFLSTLDVEANPEPEQLADLIRGQYEIVVMSLKDHFAQRGIPFPE